MSRNLWFFYVLRWYWNWLLGLNWLMPLLKNYHNSWIYLFNYQGGKKFICVFQKNCGAKLSFFWSEVYNSNCNILDSKLCIWVAWSVVEQLYTSDLWKKEIIRIPKLSGDSLVPITLSTNRYFVNSNWTLRKRRYHSFLFLSDFYLLSTFD